MSNISLKRGTKILSIAFFLTGVICIALDNSTSIIPEFLAKALLMPFLIFILALNIHKKLNHFDKLMFAGLLFSWAGDMVLEFKDLFIPGLACFLLAHVMYLVVFFKTPGSNVIFKKKWYLLIPVVLSGTCLIFYLYNDLASMKIPVILYSLVILTMLTGAINRLEKVNRPGYYLVLAGAILFVISDSAIAINKFSHPFDSAGIVIMMTYILAQYLILIGFIKQNKNL